VSGAEGMSLGFFGGTGLSIMGYRLTGKRGEIAAPLPWMLLFTVEPLAKVVFLSS